MSDILTLVTLPNSKYSGYMARGRMTVRDVLNEAREMALRDRDDAEACLNALDADFQVEIVRGSVVAHPVKTLQVARIRFDSSNPTEQGTPAGKAT